MGHPAILRRAIYPYAELVTHAGYDMLPYLEYAEDCDGQCRLSVRQQFDICFPGKLACLYRQRAIARLSDRTSGKKCKRSGRAS